MFSDQVVFDAFAAAARRAGFHKLRHWDNRTGHSRMHPDLAAKTQQFSCSHMRRTPMQIGPSDTLADRRSRRWDRGTYASALRAIRAVST
jgi:hypothetical protein